MAGAAEETGCERRVQPKNDERRTRIDGIEGANITAANREAESAVNNDQREQHASGKDAGVRGGIEHHHTQAAQHVHRPRRIRQSHLETQGLHVDQDRAVNSCKRTDLVSKPSQREATLGTPYNPK